MMSTGREFEVTRVGVFAPRALEVEELGPGEVGFLMAGIKEVDETKIGDTVTEADAAGRARRCPASSPSSRWCSRASIPSDSAQYEVLRDAVEKLRLNDAAVHLRARDARSRSASAFAAAFSACCTWRSSRSGSSASSASTLITTAPTVAYRVTKTAGEIVMVDSPAKLPPSQEVEEIEEPYILASIHLPAEFVGEVLALCEEKRGRQRELRYIGENRVVVEYELPLGEIVLDFYDRLKSVSRATRRSTTSSSTSGPPSSSSSTSASTAIPSTRCRSSSTATRRTTAAATSPRR